MAWDAALSPCQLLTLAACLLSPNLNGLACQVSSVATLNKLHEAGLPRSRLSGDSGPFLCNIHLFPVFKEEEKEEGRELAEKEDCLDSTDQALRLKKGCIIF